MTRSPLKAISPIDGRYQPHTDAVAERFSEYALIRARVQVEAAWFQALVNEARLPELSAPEAQAAAQVLARLAEAFTEEHAQRVKALEARTNHDVKAVEYMLKDHLAAQGIPTHIAEFVHFACTSEDINNLAYAGMLKDIKAELLQPGVDSIIGALRQLAGALAETPMLARTHGQPASPTTMGKELAVFVERLVRARTDLASSAIFGKLNGAVGNYNAHYATYPEVDWPTVAARLIHGLGLELNPRTTQIEPHDYIAAHAHALMRINTILLDLCRDLWGYIALGYFKQRTEADEVGSSTMPHKVNPIDFENAEGNLGLANALWGFFAEKLPVSRWQRDLSDSTVLRSVGTAVAHCTLAYRSLAIGLAKLEFHAPRADADLDGAWEVLAEPIQTILRRYGVPEPYEQLKALTRGRTVDADTLRRFIDGLDLPEHVQRTLAELTPRGYLGNASAQARASSTTPDGQR